MQPHMRGRASQWDERRFICWTGLRGAVPIAIYLHHQIQAWHRTASWGAVAACSLALSVVLLGLLIQGFALVPIAHDSGR